jgi:hypothetical protein
VTIWLRTTRDQDNSVGRKKREKRKEKTIVVDYEEERICEKRAHSSHLRAQL